MKKRRMISFTLPIMASAVLCLTLAVSRLEQGRRKEGKDLLEDVLRRTAVACYAAEGVYPPDVEYMQQHYGLQYNEDRYTVHYEVFASNLMPDITVLDNGS